VTLILTAHVIDANGDNLTVNGKIDGATGPGYSILGGTPPTVVDPTLNQFFTPGTHTVTITVSDFNSSPITCTIMVKVLPGTGTLDWSVGRSRRRRLG
jgi:hypothetical protein